MNSSNELETTPNEQSTIVNFRSGYTIDINNGESGEIYLRAPDGTMCVSIEVTEKGPLIKLSGVDLSICAQNRIDMNCRDLNVNAENGIMMRTQGIIRLDSDHEINVNAKERITTKASIQEHTSAVGDYQVKANDDVRLDGERIRLNSPKTSTEVHQEKLLKEMFQKMLFEKNAILQDIVVPNVENDKE